MAGVSRSRSCAHMFLLVSFVSYGRRPFRAMVGLASQAHRFGHVRNLSAPHFLAGWFRVYRCNAKRLAE